MRGIGLLLCTIYDNVSNTNLKIYAYFSHPHHISCASFLSTHTFSINAVLDLTARAKNPDTMETSQLVKFYDESCVYIIFLINVIKHNIFHLGFLENNTI